MNKFILEIGTEELPAEHVSLSIEELKKNAKTIFLEYELNYKKLEVYGTYRRIVLIVFGLDPKQKDKKIEIIGPPKKVAYDENNNPTHSAIGFAKSQNVKLNELKIKTTEKGEYVFVEKILKGKKTSEILKEISKRIIYSFEFPKSMRWETDLRFSRPIRWIFSSFNNHVVKFDIDSLVSNKFTYGHKFLVDKKIEIKNNDYIETLKKNFVIVDQNKRRIRIKNMIFKLAKPYIPLIDAKLIERITNSVEYPTAILCEFNLQFLSIPQEILVYIIKMQRCVPMVDKKGNIIPYFIVITDSGGKKHVVKRGYEKVINARLKDAEFFYNKDLSHKFEDNVEKLKNILWLENFGSLYDKTIRLVSISNIIGKMMNFTSHELTLLEKAAYLSKADQISEMVKEFTDLEGIVGSIYAKKSGLHNDVAVAISELYLPKFAGDKFPSSKLGIALNISEKMDNIICCFYNGLVPTGSEDPYGVRKDAIAIIRILINSNIPISINQIIDNIIQVYSIKFSEKIVNEIKNFMNQRLENVLLEEGIPYDVVNAIISPDISPYKAIRKAKVILKLKKRKNFGAYVTTFLRIINILPKEIKEKKCIYEVDENLFEKEQEKKLYESYKAIYSILEKNIANYEYGLFFNELIKLCPYINDFFDNVLVMAKDEKIRNNRLGLIYNIYSKLSEFADLTKLSV